MGSEDFYPEERPVREVDVDGFWIDAHPVTVREFRRFVKETGYVTVAERPLDPEHTRTPTRRCSSPGSLVFQPTPRAGRPARLPRLVALRARAPCWHRPEGPGTDTYTRGRHPVTHVAHEDAAAYAAWAGKALPTEAEWERAARGGLDGATFAWGDEERPGGAPLANTWQGEFPWQNTARGRLRGHVAGRRVPGQRLRAPRRLRQRLGVDGGLVHADARQHAPSPCCAPPAEPRGEIPRRVIKGGSHLCAPSYCLRYRPAARQGEAIDTSTSHLGFRCIVRVTRPRDAEQLSRRRRPAGGGPRPARGRAR